MWQPDPQAYALARKPPPLPPEPVAEGDGKVLPIGVTYNRLNGNGDSERARPFIAWLPVDGKSVYLGHFDNVETAVEFRHWAMVQHDAGRPWKLTPAERLEWERTGLRVPPPPEPESRPTVCLYPNLAASTAYSYGCKCVRCSKDKVDRKRALKERRRNTKITVSETPPPHPHKGDIWVRP